MRSDEILRKRPPSLFAAMPPAAMGLGLQGSDAKKLRCDLDPPGEHGRHHQPNVSPSRQALVHNGTAVVRQAPNQPGIVRSRPGLGSASQATNSSGKSIARIQRIQLLSKGHTNEGAITIDSDDDEVEVVFSVQVARPTTPSRAPSMLPKGWIGSMERVPREVKSAAFPVVRNVPAPDPAGSFLAVTARTENGNPSVERQILQRQFAAGFLSQALAAKPGKSTEYGKEQNPIEITDVDTEEDFATMEVEVISIEDSDDDDSDDDSLAAYARALGANSLAEKPPPDCATRVGSLGGASARYPPFAQSCQHFQGNINRLEQAVKKSSTGNRETLASKRVSHYDLASSDDEVEVVRVEKSCSWSLSSSIANAPIDSGKNLSSARNTQVDGSMDRQIRDNRAEKKNSSKSRRKQELLPIAVPSARLSKSRIDGGDSFYSTVARMPAGQKTRELKEKQDSHSHAELKKHSAWINDSQNENDDQSDMESEQGLRPSFRKEDSEPYSVKQFSRLWSDAEVTVGDTETLEKQKNFQKTKSTEQYGKILPKGMKRIFKRVMGLTKDDVFVDIGSGIANLVLQAAYTVGCKAKGIECVVGRCEVAEKFEGALSKLANEHKKEDGMAFQPGKVELKTGELQDKKFRKWIVDGTDFAFVNNFGSKTLCGSFSGARDGSPSLDGHVAALFAMMKEGAVLVTLEPLLAALGCLSRSAANKKRRKLGLPESDDASFYEVQKHRIGKQCDVVSWSEGSGCQEEITVFRYTRTKQPGGKAVHLCNNPSCENALLGIPIPAVVYDATGAATVGICDCRISDRPVRKRKKTVPFGK